MKLNIKAVDIAMANACIDVRTLSKLSGVSEPTLIAVRGKRRNPKPITIGKIAKALGVEVKDIIEE